MGYIKATQILPIDLLIKIQEYVDGKCIYIPKLDNNKDEWGANTSTRQEFESRNKRIYEDYLKGQTTDSLCDKYFLSLKSIQRIIRQQKQSVNY